MKAKVLGLILLALMVGASAASAETIQLSISDGTTLYTISDNDAQDTDSTVGVISFSASFTSGVFVAITQASATGSGVPVNPAATLSLGTVSTLLAGPASSGTLTIMFSQAGNTLPITGAAMSTSGSFTAPYSGATYTAYADPGNNLFGTSQQIGQLGFTTPGLFSGSTSGNVAVGSPYSLTQVLQFQFSGHPQFDNGATFNNATLTPLTPIPEPTSLLLLGGGLSGAALLSRRRRSKRSND